jgi:exodeoxyribonuclease V alpha subunit
MQEQQIIEGIADDIIFHNQDNGYSVFILKTELEEITCVGSVIDLHEGESLKIVGTWIAHPTYGDQFKIEFYEKTIPKTEQAIEKYLASGVIKGIGEKMAKKIVKKFGEKTFEVIEEEPQRLAQIKGITEEKAQAISEVFHEQAELRSIMLYLQQYDITLTYAMKIYKRYKGQTMNIIKANPYKLADDIFGIGFKMADDIAKSMGIGNDSGNRIKSGIKYILNQASNEGHVYLPKEIAINNAAELLGLPIELIENFLIELQIDKQIYIENLEEKDIIYLSSFYHTEVSVAQKLLELNQVSDNSKDDLIDKKIKTIEQEQGITLATNQKQAVKEAMLNGVLVITGGPGTGKTTTINTVISLLEAQGDKIVLAAPTGRAAKRMTEATGREAQTIHRLLEINFLQEDARRQSFEKNEENPIEADVIIIDETSMVDIMLMNSLLHAITPGTRLILAGDADQLPSVGPGNVLKDIIKSDCIKVVRLNEIFRQAGESAIVLNAHRINNGEYPVINEKDKDFFFMKRASVEDVLGTIVELVSQRLPKYINSNKKADIQILSPMRKSPLGINALNSLLQNKLNPPDKNKPEKEFRNIIYREGDKVMQIKNNYNIVWLVRDEAGNKLDEGIGIFNGDEGIITSVNTRDLSITVKFDDGKIVEYDSSQLDELELAYAITIHKSQGSEYPVVIIPIHSGPPMLMSRNLLYTAVTRAKKLVVIVGLQDTVNRMVDNNREINRYSSLNYRLQHFAANPF